MCVHFLNLTQFLAQLMAIVLGAQSVQQILNCSAFKEKCKVDLYLLKNLLTSDDLVGKIFLSNHKMVLYLVHHYTQAATEWFYIQITIICWPCLI